MDGGKPIHHRIGAQVHPELCQFFFLHVSVGGSMQGALGLSVAVQLIAAGAPSHFPPMAKWCDVWFHVLSCSA